MKILELMDLLARRMSEVLGDMRIKQIWMVDNRARRPDVENDKYTIFVISRKRYTTETLAADEVRLHRLFADHPEVNIVLQTKPFVFKTSDKVLLYNVKEGFINYLPTY